VLGEPAFVARHRRRDAQREALLAEQRVGAPFALVEPPFRAIEVRAGITFTLGGIAVDADLRVLDADDRPIPGLFAAGADAGGTYDAGYMGGLVLGLVQGRAAGALAAGEAAAEGAARP
jgi:predicted oxidoreductase